MTYYNLAIMVLAVSFLLICLIWAPLIHYNLLWQIVLYYRGVHNILVSVLNLYIISL